MIARLSLEQKLRETIKKFILQANFSIPTITMVKLKRGKQFNMNLFKEVTASVNGAHEREVEIEVTSQRIIIVYPSTPQALALTRAQCFPCKYNLANDTFLFFTEDFQIQLRFGSEIRKNDFWRLVFPYWKYQEQNTMPANSRAESPSPPSELDPPNSPAATPALPK